MASYNKQSYNKGAWLIDVTAWLTENYYAWEIKHKSGHALIPVGCTGLSNSVKVGLYYYL